MGKYQYITGPDSPTIGIRAHGLKWCLISLKNERCQNCVLTIPSCRRGRDEAIGENRIKIRCRTCLHEPASRLATRAMRFLRSDGLTRPECQTTGPTWLTWIKMTSLWRQHAQLACHVSAQSAQWDPPATSSSNRVEPSRGKGSSVADPTCNRIWDWI
jgi:hypothetical protein